MFSGASRILVLGDVWRDFIVTRIPTVSDRVEVLPNGSSARSSLPKRLPGRSVTILFLGEVCARKGVPQLVEALARLDDVSGWRAVLAGDGELQETVKSVTSLGMGKRISVLGWVGALEVQSLLSQADILVLPSFDENLPMAVVEAFAHGLAVVATPAGATGEIVIHGETGLLVHAGDVTGLAASLRRLLLDRDLRARLGQAALEFHGTNLEIGQYVKRLHRVWRDVAQLSEKYAKPRV
jgi:glycosyltransferase involved in cell wall biosynthesis